MDGTNDRPLRLLVVDDDEIDRERLRRCLEESDLRCELDEVSRPAALIADDNLRRYDCLIIDYRFPEGDSLALFAPLLDIPCSARPPVVMLTGPGDECVAVEAMKRGVQDYLAKDRLSYSTLHRAVDGAMLKARTERLLEQRTAALERLSFYDGLTDLPNRRLFLDRLEQMLRTAARNATPFALMVMDLNLFKEVNDTLGHDAGDEVLRRVGERLQARARDSDTIARLGDDEFAAVLPTTQSNEGALALAQGLCEAVAEPIALDGELRRIGISIGIAMYPEHGATGNDLLARADRAMYDAKGGSRGYSLYQSTPGAGPPRSTVIACGLADAVNEQQFVIEYQPQVDLRTGELSGIEALLRWRHPDLGLLPPMDFVPAAERTATIKPLTLHVIEQVAVQTRAWLDLGLAVPVAVNLSPRLLDDADLPMHVVQRLAPFDLPPHSLTLEITETGIMQSPQQAARIVEALAQAGIRISIDDFGAGYSSLKYLNDFAIDEIKIDRHFMTRQRDGRESTVIRAIVELGRGFGARVVAEGIESEHDWRKVGDLGCEHGQGYHISPAVSAVEFARWYRDRGPVAAAGAVAAGRNAAS